MKTAVTIRKKSGVARELNAILTIAARDITISFKKPAILIFSLIMPLFFMVMLGGNLSQNMAGELRFDYGQFMMVGMIVYMLFMATANGIASLVEDKTMNFTQEMMISPISRYSILLGKIFGSFLAAPLQIVGTILIALIMGIRFSFGQFLAVLLISPVICLAAGAVGVMIIAFIKNSRVAGLVTMAIMIPQMFLSGAIIPISHSSGLLFVLSRIMPMTYCLDLARSVFYAGTPDYAHVVLFSPVVNVLVIAAMTMLFLIIGTFFFTRSETNR